MHAVIGQKGRKTAIMQNKALRSRHDQQRQPADTDPDRDAQRDVRAAGPHETHDGLQPCRWTAFEKFVIASRARGLATVRRERRALEEIRLGRGGKNQVQK